MKSIKIKVHPTAFIEESIYVGNKAYVDGSFFSSLAKAVSAEFKSADVSITDTKFVLIVESSDEEKAAEVVNSWWDNYWKDLAAHRNTLWATVSEKRSPKGLSGKVKGLIESLPTSKRLQAN